MGRACACQRWQHPGNGTAIETGFRNVSQQCPFDSWRPAASTGDTATGIEEIKLAYDFNPRDEEAAYQLGMAYFHAGDYRAALQMFQAVKNLKGTVLVDNVPLLWPLSLYRIGQCYGRLGDPSEAKPYYAEVAKIWAHADSDVRQKYPAIDGALK
jgi:tetratricopeptide (TPR) repeat protein